MIVAPITFKYVKIAKYSRDETIIHIVFNDGTKDRALERKADYNNAEEFASKVLVDVRNAVKEKNQQNGSGLLGDLVTVRFTSDEEEVMERLTMVFGRVREEIRKAKSAKIAQNYLQTVTNLQGAVFKLE